jgi:hypothetical protein
MRQIAARAPQLLPLALECFASRSVSPSLHPVSALKKWMLGDELKSAAWHYLVRHGARICRIPWELAPQGENPGAVKKGYLQTFSRQAFRPLPPMILRALTRIYARAPEFGLGWCDVPPKVLNMALREANRLRESPHLARFLGEFMSVCQWSTAECPAIGKGTAWKTLVPRARDWENLLRAETENSAWRCAMERWTHGRYAVHALDNAMSLVEEAIAMRNCVAIYVAECESGELRLFSLRSIAKDKRLATFSLEAGPDGWRLHAIKGFANAPAPAALVALARTFAEEYTSRTRMWKVDARECTHR